MQVLGRRLRCLGGHLSSPTKCLPQQRHYTDTFIPATFEKLEVSEHSPVVNGYMTDGFIIRSNIVHGSVALLPRGFFNWKVRSPAMQP